MVAQTLLLLGDSIANGLGVRRRTYGQIVAAELGHRLIDLSRTARQVSESLQLTRGLTERPTIALVAHGITESIVRPRPRALALVPPRWRRTGWMDPRPYFSSHPNKRRIQMVESGVRWRVRNALIHVGGGDQLQSLDSFSDDLQQIVEDLQARGTRVLTLGQPSLDGRYFAGSPAESQRYEGAMQALDAEHVVLRGRLREWGDFLADHFHPNDDGHEAIADIVLAAIRGTQG
ncbi:MULTISPECIES: GDSL-type esterase/lipase family protein [unclassified Curtobacterium]|uniref:SGNH/GDSL hydrolase family protein n=1 Tax=unclassified Curtobacterium TaxID=257496 RepID=UPI0015E8A266|nr:MULTISPECIES: GDSL-type esterase/lipase family protein [unclassified Curtobacterium]